MEKLNTKILILVLIIGILLLSFLSWRQCDDFKEFLKLSSVNTSLHLEDLIHTDAGINPVAVRIFHNKIVDFSLILLRKYLLFFDIRFGINFFSIVGYVGVISSLYYVSTSWKKLSFLFKVYVITALILPLIQIVFEPQMRFEVRIIMFYILYSGLIAYGLLNVLKIEKWGKIIVLILTFLSIWWLLAMKSEVASYCIGIVSGLQ